MKPATENTLNHWLNRTTQNLAPGSFAVVMATGAIALSAKILGFIPLSNVLLWVNIVIYIFLWIVLIMRAYKFPRNLSDDFRDLGRGTGFLTIVAGSAILGSQFVLLDHQAIIGIIFLGVSGILWLLLNYGLFFSFITKINKSSFETEISGTWLLITVAIQSISALLSVLQAQYILPYCSCFNFISFSLWLLGDVFYIVIILLILYRMIFFKLSAQDLMPPYWINMGAASISTLAGALLVSCTKDSLFLHDLIPFIKGFTLLFWTTATWWIPLLFILGWWRFIVHKINFSYDSSYWGMVFPLGMYSLCTLHLEKSFSLSFLFPLAYIFFFIALTAWTVTMLAFLHKTYVNFLQIEYIG